MSIHIKLIPQQKLEIHLNIDRDLVLIAKTSEDASRLNSEKRMEFEAIKSAYHDIRTKATLRGGKRIIGKEQPLYKRVRDSRAGYESSPPRPLEEAFSGKGNKPSRSNDDVVEHAHV